MTNDRQPVSGEREPGRPLRMVLVQPSDQQAVQSLFPYHKDHSIGHKPPQSILILATYLRQQGFPDTHCLDAQMEGWSPEHTAEVVAKMQPDVVGITAWTDFWYPTWRTVQCLRKLMPNVTILLGGPHCAVYPEEAIQFSDADFVVCGDGEDVLLAMAQDLQAGRPVAELAGVWRKGEGGKAQGPKERFAVVKDITAIPPPDRTLLPYKRYSSVLTPADYETTMVTSRGCPYKCVFCKMDVQKVYSRSAEQVVEEFRQIAALGIKDVQVYDDTFTWGNQRAIDICQGIIDSGIKINWAIRDRANRVTPELYALLKRAGCYRVHFGVETGSPSVLKASGKFLTLEQIENAVAIATKIGMTVMTYYMFGFLDETPEDARMTIEFAKKLNSDYPVFIILIPYPGTAIYDDALKRGIIPRDHWREFAQAPIPDYRIPHVIENIMDRKTLLEMRNTGTRELYFTPRRVLKELKTITSVSEFKRKAKLGWILAAEAFRPANVSAPTDHSG